jgi:hypothetical protein
VSPAGGSSAAGVVPTDRFPPAGEDDYGRVVLVVELVDVVVLEPEASVVDVVEVLDDEARGFVVVVVDVVVDEGSVAALAVVEVERGTVVVVVVVSLPPGITVAAGSEPGWTLRLSGSRCCR